MTTPTAPVPTSLPGHIDPGSEATIARTPGSNRLISLDAVRGLAIVVMLLALHPGPNQYDPMQLRHPSWHGLTFADLFFPLFLFAIGTSMTLSARAADLRHVLRRAGLLLLLGVALSSLKYEQLFVTGVLQHIAGAYLVAYAILRAPRRWHAPLGAALVGVYWAASELWAWGDDAWGRSGTLAAAANEAVLGRFSTEGILQTAVSAVAIVGGAAAGRLVAAQPDRRALVRQLAVRAVLLIGAGLLIALVVPLNKRLWSPSFAVLTVGTSFAWLAIGVRVIDVAKRQRLAAPLVHLGTNPIAVYVVFLAALALLQNHAVDLLPALEPFGSPTAGAMAYAVAWTILGWAFAYALYRRKILIKI